ncbi:MAG: eukaryotic-like serine/threonine-protein kinase [Acidobacteriota bacterium]|nr:eukaryotic-like serine/threonine-protein kinase [Acidobacteriota bacterium]
MKECPVCRRCFPDQVNHCPDDGDATTQSIAGEPILDGRYQLDRRIGHGGMGVVYQARHIFLKTAHAIKVILPDLVGNDPMLVTRFRQEALAAAAIRHQNIIAVTDFGILRGTMPFLVMEYVSGKSLHDLLLEEGALPPSRALEIFSAVGAGVAAAHRQGIVHRDLKPLNIMFQEGLPVAEAVKVLDFGLAKIKSGELLGSFVQAKTSGLMGSPFYMAPEQWGDEEPDARADIYSLGVILYQMLGGDVPFKGTSIPSIMKKHLTTAPPSFASLGVTVPPEIEAVVRHALEKEAENRPASVEDFIRELREAVDSLSASLKRTSLGTFNSQSQTIIEPHGLTSIPPDATTLRIHTNPPRSRVYINNVSVGITDNAGELVVPDMLRGAHRVQVLHDGYAEWSRQVECSGGVCDVEAKLQSLTETSGAQPSVFGHHSLGDPYAGTISGPLNSDFVPQQSQASMEAQRLRQQAEVLEEQARQEEASRQEELARQREQARLEEEERKGIALLQQAREEAAREKAEKEARLEAEAEARRKAEEEAERVRVEEEARLKAEEEERLRAAAEEEEKRRAEEKAAQQREEETARAKEEERARVLAEAQERAEEEAKLKAEAEAARLRAEEEARQRAEAEAEQKRAEEDAARRRAEEEQRQRVERERVEALERERVEREQKERDEQAAHSSVAAIAPPVNLEATQSQRQGIITQPVDEDGLSEDEQPTVEGGGQHTPQESQAAWRSRQPTFDSSLHNVAGVVPKRQGVSKALIAAIIGIAIIAGGIGAWLMLGMRSGRGARNRNNVQNQNGVEQQTPTPTPTQTQTPPPPPVNFKPEFVSIPSGTMEMGSDNGTVAESPAHLVVVKPFSIDKTEVTNAEYADFVRETRHEAPSNWANGQPIAGTEMAPVVNVSYEDAVEFAKWRSKRDKVTYRLPTEEEWEYAARGGDQGNLYPWGNTWDKDGAGVMDPRVIVPKPVGSYPKDKTRWGVLDMEGNVYEWTSSKASYYKGNQQQVRPENKNWIVRRGASFSADSELKLPLTFRNWNDPKLKNNLVGFRLVRPGS